ncbi:MAG: GNAT family N-acetyltransferase [Chloroflexi bacterium]|jgi:ribosomal protein S18 acetylase RimI-like enzyme|nr:GNAT family N-acetyltransferase [Chloroflexota bacterium]
MRGLEIRALELGDLPTLSEINPTFVSDVMLKVEREEQGTNLIWRLTEVPLERPFDRGIGYNLTPRDLEDMRGWLKEGNGLHLLALDLSRPVALLNVQLQAWNNTGFIWNILIDIDYRRRGLGRTLIERAIAWARQNNLRALCLETQTNNLPAIRFYRRMGFFLSGVRADLYTNRDLERGEVALFFSYPLDS